MYKRIALGHLILFLCLLPGCGEEGEKQTLQGLKEENQALRERAGFLEQSLEEQRREYERRLALLQSESIEKAVRLEALSREAAFLGELLKAEPRLRALADAGIGHERLVYFLIITALAVLALYGWRQSRSGSLGRGRALVRAAAFREPFP